MLHNFVSAMSKTTTYLFHQPSSGGRSTPRPPPRKLSIIVISVCVSFGLLYYLHIMGNSVSMSLSAFYKPKYQWRPEFSNLNGPDIPGSDPRVISKLKNNYLIAPPLPTQSQENNPHPYNLSEPWIRDPSVGQSAVIQKIFKDKLRKNEPGFFIECGALDGETRSNTLYLERFKSWSGLLVEADPSNFEKLKEKNRRSYLSPTCLSTKSYPVMVSFEQNSNQGKISQTYSVGFIEKNHVDVQCFPFETYMLTLNRTHVDYFSLDVEGAELDILRTIDFNKFDITTLSVEFIHDVDGKVAIKEFMSTKGYFVLTEVTHPNWLANDFIFVKKQFYDEALSSDVKDNLEVIHRAYLETGAIQVGDNSLPEILI